MADDYSGRRRYAQGLLDDADNLQSYVDDYYRAAKRAREMIRTAAESVRAGDVPFYTDAEIADQIRRAETERRTLDEFLRRRV